MGIKEYVDRKKREKLPLIARVDLVELQKQREKEMEDRDISILASADFTKRLPTIRLCYASLEKFNRYGTGQAMLGETYGFSSPFRLPREMSIEDACKVVTYLSNKVEFENKLDPACETSVIKVSNLLDKYGFEKVESKEKGHYHAVSEYNSFGAIKTPFPVCNEIEGVVDLFTVGGDFKLFKRTNMHNRYFNWYKDNVTEDEIFDIYKKIRQEHLLPDEILFGEDKSL